MSRQGPRKIRDDECVDFDEAARRILTALVVAREPWVASQFADAVWPNHRMGRQGAALAASPIVRRLRDRGDLELAVRAGRQFGLVISPAGRRRAALLTA